jgi:hypothetical protein
MNIYILEYYARDFGPVKNSGVGNCGSYRCALLAPFGGAIIFEK